MASFDEITVLPSAARTALVTVQSQKIPRGAKLATFVINETAHAATPGVTFTVQLYSVTSGTWIDILASAAVTGEGTTLLTVGPYVAAVANAAAPCPLPYDGLIGIKAAVADTDSCTYSVALMFG